jgi:16S rRNA (guanine(966)-N(2))-methyltransferase RsmD
MRIIAGLYRSRVIDAPPGLSTRPTSDRLRETLFNVLAPRIQGASFLDLYAGSGAVGVEAISRGALHTTFIERSPAALKVLRGNLARLGVSDGFRVYPDSVSAFLRSVAKAIPKQEQYEVLFLDPPYDAEQEYAATLMMFGGEFLKILASGALVIAEHRRKQSLDLRYGSLKRTRLLEQGDAALSFYQAESRD